jgi:hypothetical protein
MPQLVLNFHSFVLGYFFLLINLIIIPIFFGLKSNLLEEETFLMDELRLEIFLMERVA